MRKKLVLFILIFCVATIITSPNFVPSHSLDSYCNIYSGYNASIVWFLQKGRVFSALMFWIYGLIHLPFDSMGFLSAFGVNLCLSGSILIVYDVLSQKINNFILKVSILILTFTMFYAPLMIEVIMFDEAMIMGLGILFTTLCALEIYKGTIKNYLFALLFMILGVMCYQGMATFLIPILILFEANNFINNDKKEILNLFKKIIIALIVYGIAFVCDLIVIKIVAKIYGSATSNLGIIDLWKNVHLIITFLLPSSIKQLFGYINVKLYYLFTIVMFILACACIFKNNFKTVNILLLFLLIVSCILMPFVPNLVMNSEENYMAARTTLTLTVLPSVIGLLSISKFNLNVKGFYYIILFFSIIVFLTYSYLIYKNTKIDLNRYKQDVTYLKTIIGNINTYENKNKIKIKHIYYASDGDSAYYYNTGYNNGANIKVTSTDWSMRCAINDFSNKNYKISYKKMDKQDYKKFFDNEDYNKFDVKQLHFNGDKLYLLIY